MGAFLIRASDMLCTYAVDEEDGGVLVCIMGDCLFFAGVTSEQMIEGQVKYDAGALVQHAFPFLNDDQREFLMTGLTPKAWDDLFGDEE
jgi:hypothetical protein